MAHMYFSPSLIIFDKDGTLIDFHYMWATWLTELARRLEVVTSMTVAAPLYKAMGFDPQKQYVEPDGRLALSPMAELRHLTGEVLGGLGMNAQAAERVVADNWFPPDPVALARPLADLPRLFMALRGAGIQIAVATSDDRAATEALLSGMGLTDYVASIVCADDRLPIKPAADMVLRLCEGMGIEPARAVMVGDAVDDLRMGRAAGVGLTVGVLSGLGTADLLKSYADVILPSVAALIV